MTLFRVVIRKAFIAANDRYKWSNVWYVEHDSVSAAATAGITIWNAERQFHDLLTFGYEIYASDLVLNTQNFVTIAIPAASSDGLFTQTGELYRPSTVYRVDLNVANGRPSRKFYRIPFYEGSVVDGLAPTSGFLTAITSGMTAVFTNAGTRIKDESGNTLTGYTLQGITDHRLGREARQDVPSAPA